MSSFPVVDMHASASVHLENIFDSHITSRLHDSISYVLHHVVNCERRSRVM